MIISMIISPQRSLFVCRELPAATPLQGVHATRVVFATSKARPQLGLGRNPRHRRPAIHVQPYDGLDDNHVNVSAGRSAVPSLIVEK
jgi:hypothetical protein